MSHQTSTIKYIQWAMHKHTIPVSVLTNIVQTFKNFKLAIELHFWYIWVFFLFPCTEILMRCLNGCIESAQCQVGKSLHCKQCWLTTVNGNASMTQILICLHLLKICRLQINCDRKYNDTKKITTIFSSLWSLKSECRRRKQNQR